MNSNSSRINSFVSHPFCRFGASYMQPSPHMNLPWPCFLAKGLASDTFRWILMETTKDTDFFLLQSYHPWKSRWRLIHLPTARCPDHPCRAWYARMCQSIVRVIIEMLGYKMTTLAKISSRRKGIGWLPARNTIPLQTAKLNTRANDTGMLWSELWAVSPDFAGPANHFASRLRRWRPAKHSHQCHQHCGKGTSHQPRWQRTVSLAVLSCI